MSIEPVGAAHPLTRVLALRRPAPPRDVWEVMYHDQQVRRSGEDGHSDRGHRPRPEPPATRRPGSRTSRASTFGPWRADSVGLSAYPFFVLLDRNHKVLARDAGELTTEQLDDLVELAGSSS